MTKNEFSSTGQPQLVSSITVHYIPADSFTALSYFRCVIELECYALVDAIGWQLPKSEPGWQVQFCLEICTADDGAELR
jgi:hypothetical protein